MARPGTFERVYAAIKEQLRRGSYRPGERLEPALLSEQHNASVTPVRDALHRLTGERLVEAPRHEGFRVPVLTEGMLRHLYAWHRDLLVLAVLNRRPPPRLETGAIAEREGFERQNALFLELVRMTGNPEHVSAFGGLAERLEPVQRLASEALDAIEQETDDILAALGANDSRRLRRALVRYHRRRMQIAPDLVERLYSEGSAAGAPR
ncbi:MAG TPA: GntR family transcriptional regulator [Sphingomicrobium sp.]|jgi:DNA-binding GntR family transcriptional regulator|nr:GntR family transcriptional regulator [Sphingomicrobium sp.]